jgi:uncharacterized membrane protein
MIKLFRFLAMCTIGVAFASSIAWAQTYKQIDYPGACPGTTGLNGGPNLEGTSLGTYEDAATCSIGHGFSLTATGVFTSFDPPGSIFTIPAFINSEGAIVGEYWDSTHISHGFILDGKEYTVVNAPGAAGTAFSGINDRREISGYSCSDPACGFFGAPNVTHSFVRFPNGVFTFFDPPGASSSGATTVTSLGTVIGFYTNTKGELNHGYLLINGKYATIDFPGALYGTFAGGGNLENDIVGIYNYISCTSDCNHAFVLHRGVFTSFDYPGAIYTVASGINALGVIVGGFQDSNGVGHGFIRTP